MFEGNPYEHGASLTQSGNTLDGTGGYPVGGPYTYAWDITSGSVIGNTVYLTMDYTKGVTCSMIMDGTINSSGEIIDGTWSDNCWGGPRNGTWTSSSGLATVVPFPLGNKMTGWNPTEYLFEDALINFTQTL